MPEKRFKMLKTVKEIEAMDDNCTEIFCNNIVDYYRERPIRLEGYSLYDLYHGLRIVLHLSLVKR